MIDGKLAERLHRQADAAKWRVTVDRFAAALEASATSAHAGRHVEPRELERYLSGLRLDDLALACACADGDDEAWEHFVREQRPHLYRAADALDPGGGARDLADSLYADLFGLRHRDGARQSLFRYFHGRSSLTTWLRAVLAQRHIDRLRSTRRLDALPEEESAAALAAPQHTVDPDRRRYLTLMQSALTLAVASLLARDRLRLCCYYSQQLTLAETGRLLGEHEATCSRQLARTRRVLRDDVERRLRVEGGLGNDEIAAAFASVVEDAGPLDLGRMLDTNPGRKEPAPDRSS